MVKIRSNDDFIKEIELIVRTKNIEFFEAVIYYCEYNNMEVEVAASIIKQNNVLKAKIQYEAENLNMMKKTPRLPI